jgi:hypothetical protein
MIYLATNTDNRLYCSDKEFSKPIGFNVFKELDKKAVESWFSTALPVVNEEEVLGFILTRSAQEKLKGIFPAPLTGYTLGEEFEVNMMEFIGHVTISRRISSVEKTWIFFEEGKEHEPDFEIKAKDFEDAFDKAYESYGPQVNDLYYKEKKDDLGGSVSREFDIDFLGMVKARIKVVDGRIEIEKAMSGWGDALDLDKIVITELPPKSN